MRSGSPANNITLCAKTRKRSPPASRTAPMSRRLPLRRPWSGRRARSDKAPTPSAALNSAWPRSAISRPCSFRLRRSRHRPRGVAVAGADGAVMGGGAAWIGYESLKKSGVYANATAALGRKDDESARIGGEVLYAQLLAPLAPFRRFVRDNEAPLRRIAKNTSRLRWMLRYIDFIMKPVTERGVVESPFAPIRCRHMLL